MENQKTITKMVANQEISIGNHKIRLAAPHNLGVCAEIVALYSVNAQRCLAASLAACWRGPGKPKTRYSANTAEFGLAVLQELQEAGISLKQINTFGLMAFSLLCEKVKLIDEAEEVAQDFLDDPADGAS